MDRRYFHGIRTTAAAALVKHAKDEIGWLGMFHLEKAFQHFFCLANSKMTRSNDFSDRASYYVQCAIPQAMAKIRDNSGKTPFEVRKFLYEKLRYNDNSNNEFSDAHYLVSLMNALTDAIASSSATTEEAFSFEPDIDNGDNPQFYVSCLEEIDRYRRLDEWIPSFQNILSSTALDCKHRLMKIGGIPIKAADYLTYTQDGCHESLRLTAFRCLMDLGLYRNDQILRWFLFVLSTDPSAYLREYMIRLLGKTLGSIAIGEFETSAKDQDAMDTGGLVVEQESSTEARQADLARKQTIPGALAALKSDLEHNEVLESSLWQAIESPTITIRELGELLQISSLLYDPVTSYLIILKYPRYWSCRNVGRSTNLLTGKPCLLVRFYRTNKIRTTFTPLVMPPPPSVRLSMPAAPAPAPVQAPPPPPPPVLKRAPSSNNSIDRLVLKPPKKPDNSRSPPAGSSASSPEAPKKLTIKFKTNPKKE
jgi:transcription initiation factor TFIID subunit 2